jgi:SAM-dependent methyltransferase
VEDAVAPDGSPVELYLRVAPGPTPALIGAAIPPASSVLDLGCGVGRIAADLVGAGHAVTGVDNSPDMLRYARERGVETVEADVLTLELGRRFDVVLLLSHLVSEADDHLRRACWRAAARHVRPGGLVVVERFSPAWVRTVEPATRVRDGVEVELHDVVHDGDVVHASVTYRIVDREWTQTFAAIAIDDGTMAEEAARHGLVVERILDDEGELVLLRAHETEGAHR